MLRKDNLLYSETYIVFSWTGPQVTLPTLRFTTARPTKMSLKNVTLHNLKSVAVISSRSPRTMWANNPKLKLNLYDLYERIQSKHMG